MIGHRVSNPSATPAAPRTSKFRVSYSLKPPRTVIHVPQCPRVQEAVVLLKMEALDARDIQRQLQQEYAEHNAQEVAIMLCPCVFEATRRLSAD